MRITATSQRVAHLNAGTSARRTSQRGHLSASHISTRAPQRVAHLNAGTSARRTSQRGQDADPGRNARSPDQPYATRHIRRYWRAARVPRAARHHAHRQPGRHDDRHSAGDLNQATAATQRVVDTGRHLLNSAVRNTLAAGLDWRAIGELLDTHPPTAFDVYANLADGTHLPAQQCPQLPVVCTARLAAEHAMNTEHGVKTVEEETISNRSADQLARDWQAR